jgi:hypothetical protein
MLHGLEGLQEPEVPDCSPRLGMVSRKNQIRRSWACSGTRDKLNFGGSREAEQLEWGQLE